MKGAIVLLCLVCAVFGHIQYLEKEAIRQPGMVKPGDDFSLVHPFDIDQQENSTVNGVLDARFISAFIARDDADYIKFTVKPGTTAIANAAAWTPACENRDHIYVNVALLGPLTDSRFEPVTNQMRREYNMKFDIPAGYGAVLGINTPPPRGVNRPTLNITLPAGEFPNKWFIPYNSGELDPEAIAFRQYLNDNSTGKLGCAFPPERCPGAPYPFNQSSPFCPHYKVGNFCGPKPWRWINERELLPGTYYYVFWERKGRPTDVGLMMGYIETLRFGYDSTRPECNGHTAATLPSNCICGQKNNLELPEGCVPLFPFSRARIPTLYPLLTDGGVWHRECDPVEYVD